MPHSKALTLAALLSATVLAAACSKRDEAPPPAPVPAPTAPEVAPAPPPVIPPPDAASAPMDPASAMPSEPASAASGS